MSVASRLRFGASSALLAYRAAYAEEEHRAALDWFRRWAGASATASIWEPLLRSKFGDAAERIPLAWMAGRLRQRARSRQGTEERLGYLQGSLQVLVDRLLEVLAEQGVEVLLGTPTEAFLYTDGRIAGVRTPRGTLQADMVLSTIATPHLSALVQDIAPDYARELSRIEYLGALCTVLSLTERLSPVYWLNVADAGYDFGGVIEQTNFIPAAAYGGQHIVYLSRYLPVTHPLWGMDDDLLLERQLDQLGTMFRRDVRPLMRKHWIFRGRFAAPLPDRGFAERIPKLRSPLRDLYVASMAHVYPDERSVNNSIRVAAEVVRIMGMDGDLVPRGMSLAGKYGT